MSFALRARATPRRAARVARHLVSTRGVEVCALQASPLVGFYLGGPGLSGAAAERFALLMVGSIALTAHVFVFNDWVDFARDERTARREDVGVAGRDVTRDEIALVATGLLVLAAVALAALGATALLIGTGIAALSVLYSLSPRLGKATPVAASVNHLVGGSLHFLLGYTLAHALDARGVVLSLFFALVFAAGHLNQEVRDLESDRANGIATSAVTFGPRRAFLASWCLFTTAYALIAGLAAAGVLPRLLLLATLAWGLQTAWSAQALRHGLGRDTALWMQRRYRLLFAAIGVAILLA